MTVIKKKNRPPRAPWAKGKIAVGLDYVNPQENGEPTIIIRKATASVPPRTTVRRQNKAARASRKRNR